MMDRVRRRCRRSGTLLFVEALETRALLSTTYAVMVMDAPQGAHPVQVDADIPSQPVNGNATLDSALDIQVRTVSDGIYLTAAVSGVDSGTPDPTGTVDFYDEAGFLGTVAIGAAYRNMMVLPAGEHTFFATYTGDDNFLPSQASITSLLINPTTTLQPSTSVQQKFAENSIGERVRPMRFLSETNYFLANGMAVASGDSVPSDTPAATPPGPTSTGNNSSGSTGPDILGAQPNLDSHSIKSSDHVVQALPPSQDVDPFDAPNDASPPTDMRFSTISFSIKVPRITHAG